MSVKKQILPNNIILITESVAQVKTAAIGFWFGIGSRYEAPHLRGITHFVEHMLFKGTENRSAFDIAAAFDRIGGYVNAFTERENMCVHCVVPASHISTALEVMCDMTSASVFEEEELERERAVIKSEIISSLDDPEEAALDAASEAVWPSHPVSASIAGSVKEVEQLERKQLLEWYKKYVAEGPLVVCAAGCVDSEEIAQRLEQLPARRKDYPEAGQAPVWQKGLVFTDAPFRQSQFFVQLPLPVPKDENTYYTLSILNAMIGDTMSSRLFQKLREEGGFSYNVYSFLTCYSDAACWCAYASADKKDCVKVAESILTELRRLLADGFADEELIAASEHLCGEEIISSEEMEYRMKRLFRNHSMGFAPCTPDKTVEQIRSVSRSMVQDALHKMLNLTELNLMVYGSKPSFVVRKKIQGLFGW